MMIKKTIISILDKDTKKLTLNMRSNDRWGYSALELAVMQQNSPLVELLIQRGANTAQKNKLNQYPLMRVFTVRNKTQRLRMAQLLMDKNININERDSNGYTVLHRAVYMNDVALVKAIVEQYGSHINPQMKDQQGRTVLEIADQNKLNDIKKILGAIINNI